MAKKRVSKKASKADRRAIEQYAHKGKSRSNNPPVGLVTTATDPPELKRKKYAYDPHLDPQLIWAGKAERTSFEVPTVSLHVHERIDPKTIIRVVRSNGIGNGAPKGKPRQQSLFEEPEENPPLRDALDFYKHKHGWTNRLIAGDSLLVMNSLLEKEGMAGKVQMIYLDPPYGIHYGSNFQPFVNRRDVADGKDDDLTQEPEMLKAFRDTWELGLHSYLTCLRDRLLLARELLHESGSIFVQISDENLHHVRELMDEVFGPACRVVDIVVKKKGSQKSSLIDPVNDYLLWYGRHPRGDGRLKFRSIFEPRELDWETLDEFRTVELPNGTSHHISRTPTPDGAVFDYRLSPRRLFQDYPNARLFRPWPITNGGTRVNQMDSVTFDRRPFDPPPPERITVMGDGDQDAQKAFRCGQPLPALSIEWVTWNAEKLGIKSFVGSLPVYVKSHALRRLYERLSHGRAVLSSLPATKRRLVTQSIVRSPPPVNGSIDGVPGKRLRFRENGGSDGRSLRSWRIRHWDNDEKVLVESLTGGSNWKGSVGD